MSVDTHALAAEVAELVAEHMTPAILNADQAAELLNVPASWVMAEARANRLPHVRFGRYVRFKRDDLLDWAGSRAVGPRR